jgi:chemotaxis protein MotB
MIWPGFVDAVTTLLMVLMFVLTIFTVMQSVLRDTITTQGTELSALNAQVASLADALGLQRARADELQVQVGGLTADLDAARSAGEEKSALIATLSSTLAEKDAALAQAQTQITSFESQLAALLSQRDAAMGELAELRDQGAQTMSEKQALDLALAQARAEVDASAEAARLAAARREALEALLGELQASAGEIAVEDSEAARLADAATCDTMSCATADDAEGGHGTDGGDSYARRARGAGAGRAAEGCTDPPAHARRGGRAQDPRQGGQVGLPRWRGRTAGGRPAR